MDDCLRQQHALEALHTHLSSLRLKSPNTTIGDGGLLREEAAEICSCARRTAVECHDIQQVQAQLCGVSPGMSCVHNQRIACLPFMQKAGMADYDGCMRAGCCCMHSCDSTVQCIAMAIVH